MLIDTLRQLPHFSSLGDDVLEWLVAHSCEVRLNADEVLFAEGDPGLFFYVLLEGQLRITKRIGAEDTILATHQPGNFTGEVPLLTGTAYIATARTLQPSHLLQIEKAGFEELLATCPPLRSVVFSALAQRLQSTEAQLRQREKMAALGMLAAGLAHELNNPAAAGRRAASDLRESILVLHERILRLNQQLDREQLGVLAAVQHDALLRAGDTIRLDPLAQSDREDELSDWLATHGIEDGWRLAPTLVQAGLETERLDVLVNGLTTNAASAVLTSLEAALAIAGLLDQVERSTSRISELVAAIKSYSYMDQAPLQDVDVHTAIETTLTILAHKLGQGVVVTREYDRSLPSITAYGSELNQVWTNLLDNAIDAVGDQGQIWIRTWREHDKILVEIADSGVGIPLEIQPRIFEPFFTTKEMGKGTGLGLDIVYRVVVARHHGDIRVESRPGLTRFQVRLPIRPAV
ncbi:MAG: ATP-binding protein [Chloroflexota bacterium]|nr:ATP-binding protein [Chloroflexota bacterium]